LSFASELIQARMPSEKMDSLADDVKPLVLVLVLVLELLRQNSGSWCAFLRPSSVTRAASQGKMLLLRAGAPGFTCVRVQMMIGRSRPLPGYTTTPASYPVSVRRLRAGPKLLPPRLTATQLPSAYDSHHQGSQRTCTSCINAMPGAQRSGGA
jgi:hypothetical protein